MRKLFFVFIFLFASRILFSQIISISCGQFHDNLKNLNSQLETQGASKTFLPINSIGIDLGAPVNVTRSGNCYSSICLEDFLPQKISVGNNLKYNLGGWHLMTSIYGFRIINKTHFAFIAGPGIDWGSVKITGNSNGHETHFWNPFISPFGRADIRFMIWRIAIGARGSYRFDISKKYWKQDNNNLPNLANSKMTGLGLQLFLGFNLDNGK